MFACLVKQKILPAFPSYLTPSTKTAFSQWLAQAPQYWLTFFLRPPNFPLTTPSPKPISLTCTGPWYRALQTEIPHSMKAPLASGERSPGQTGLTVNCIRTQLQFPALQQFKVLADLTPPEPHVKMLRPYFPCYACVYVFSLHTSNKASKHELLITLQSDFPIPFKFGHFRIFLEKYSIIDTHHIRRTENSFLWVQVFDPCSNMLLTQFYSTLWSFLAVLPSLQQTVELEHTSRTGVSVLPVFTANSQLHNIKHKSKLLFPIALYERAEYS